MNTAARFLFFFIFFSYQTKNLQAMLTSESAATDDHTLTFDIYDIRPDHIGNDQLLEIRKKILAIHKSHKIDCAIQDKPDVDYFSYLPCELIINIAENLILKKPEKKKEKILQGENFVVSLLNVTYFASINKSMRSIFISHDSAIAQHILTTLYKTIYASEVIYHVVSLQHIPKNYRASNQKFASMQHDFMKEKEPTKKNTWRKSFTNTSRRTLQKFVKITPDNDVENNTKQPIALYENHDDLQILPFLKRALAEWQKTAKKNIEWKRSAGNDHCQALQTLSTYNEFSFAKQCYPCVGTLDAYNYSGYKIFFLKAIQQDKIHPDSFIVSSSTGKQSLLSFALYVIEQFKDQDLTFLKTLLSKGANIYMDYHIKKNHPPTSAFKEAEMIKDRHPEVWQLINEYQHT